MVTIDWSDQAKDDLKDIYDYIALSSKRYARDTVDKIILSTKILETNPFLGKMADNFQNPNFREIIRGNYKIYYKVLESKNISIASIIHGKRDVEFQNV